MAIRAPDGANKCIDDKTKCYFMLDLIKVLAKKGIEVYTGLIF